MINICIVLYNWVLRNIVFNDYLLEPLWSILTVVPTQLLAPISVLPVLIALLEVPFLPAIMIYLPHSALLIMLITVIIGSLGAVNLYVNYRFLINNWGLYMQIAYLVNYEFTLQFGYI